MPRDNASRFSPSEPEHGALLTAFASCRLLLRQCVFAGATGALLSVEARGIHLMQVAHAFCGARRDSSKEAQQNIATPGFEDSWNRNLGNEAERCRLFVAVE